MTTPSSTKEEPSLNSFQPASPPTTPPIMLLMLVDDAEEFPCVAGKAPPQDSSRRRGEADNTVPVLCPSRRHYNNQLTLSH
jgi:hypothetical protein